MEHSSPQPYWNIFARTLQDILQHRQIDLAHLHNHVEIPQETVQRLVRSLHMPPGLPILSLDEMEQTVERLRLNPQEVTQLKAALLATVLQRELMSYIWQDDTRLVVEQVFPIVLQSLAVHGDEKVPDDGRGDAEAGEGSGIGFLLSPAVDAIERGREELNQSTYAGPHDVRIYKAHQAQSSFTQAIAFLKSLNRAIQGKRDWRYWFDEAQKGLSAATKQLAKLDK